MATNTRRLAALLGASGAGLTDSATASKITTDSLKDDAVTNAKIGTDAVNADSIVANAVGTSEVADNVLTATDLAANSVGESELSVDYTTVKPHIIPGVLQPAIGGKLLNGANHSGAYGTAQTQSGGDGHSYYYTDIKGSKPIKDPRIGAHFGSQRHKFKSTQFLEQETATHGDEVYSVDGRDWIRRVGKFDVHDGYGAQGHFLGHTATGDATNSKYFEIVGYFNAANYLSYVSTDRHINVFIDGTQNPSSTVTAGTAVDTPLANRYVDSSSVINIPFTGLTTPGIHTLKIANVSGDYLLLFGIELIAQDTTSTARRSEIKIPKQNVVSYGKKFEVGSDDLDNAVHPHYDPFNGFTSGNLASVQALGIDTDTSLGLSKWLPSDATSTYYRPFNGGRVVRWVDSSGTIKTSVNMMPPNAKSIANSASPTNAFATRTTASHFGTNNAMNSFEAGTDLDSDQLSEVAKTFHHREFGNGNANGGATGTYKDVSMLDTTSRAIVYVMDDGLTSIVGDDVHIGTNVNMVCYGDDDSWYLTFIGTGLTFTATQWGAGTKHIVQNLPYGTHVMRVLRHSGTSAPRIHIDGVDVNFTSGTYGTVEEITFHQPKRPPISEDAVVISDYMLYADWVAMEDAEVGMISKGARKTNCSRDVFVNRDSGSNNPTLAIQVTNANGSANFGFRITGGVGSPCSVDLPVFSNKFALYAENPAGGSQAVSFGGASSTISVLDNSANDDLDAVVGPTTATDLGVNKIEYTLAGQYHFSGFDSAGIIHTSSHYQSFETPFLHELIGGDRNMEQTNLVVSPDGRTWDEISRDTSYLGPKVALQIQADASGDHASEMLIFTKHRGDTTTGHNGNKFNKGIAYGYDRVIILENGEYDIYFSCYSGAADIDVFVKLNDAQTGGARGTGQIKQLRIDPADEVGIFKSHLQLKRGDFICIATNSIITKASSILEIRKRD